MCRRCKLPPAADSDKPEIQPDALGFLKKYRTARSWVLFGIIMAFGHSVLAMSGEETLAQVNREIAHPKLKNLKRAAIVIAIYSLVFTGSRRCWLRDADSGLVRMPVYQDNLIAGLAMYMAGPRSGELMFRVFRRVRRISDSLRRHQHLHHRIYGVLMRVAEDGVLTDWFRQPHPKFGTSYRIVNLVSRCRCSRSLPAAEMSSLWAKRTHLA